MALVNPGIAMGVQTYQPPSLMNTAAKTVDIQNALVNQQAKKQDMERLQYAQALQKSRDALSFISTPEQYLAWHESNHQDPVLGSMLSKMGITADQGRAKIMAELQQPGGLERLIQQSSASADQLGSIMSGRLNAMAAERKAAAGQAQTAAQQAQVNAVMGRGAPAAAAPAASTAQAFPVAPPVDTGVYEPGTPGAINQMYAQSRAGQTPALNALAAGTTQPGAMSQADQLLAEIGQLRRLAVSNPLAAKQADQLQKQYDLLVAREGGEKLSERFVPVGGNIYDRQNQQWDVPPTKQDIDELKPKLEKGERWNEETGRVEAVPGSKLYIEQSQKHAKSLQTYKAVNTKVQQINEKIDEILSPDNASAFAGNFGGYNAYATQMLPGENSNLRKKIDSFKSNMKAIGLELMRSGGSIGQMTEKEWPIVEQMLGAIDPVLGEEDARMQFERIKARVNNILTNSKDIYSTEWGDTQYYKPIEGAKALSAQDRQALEWANANPEDPRAAEIKRRLGQ